MGWWTSIVDSAKSFGNGASWGWDKIPVSQAVGYATNTVFYVVEQGLALREAIPALITPSVLKIIEGMGNILFYDILPIVAVNYANNGLQTYFRNTDLEEQQPVAMLAPYSLFLSTLSLINYGVTAYTYRQGAKLVVHTLLLDSVGPSAFNEHKSKKTPAHSLCIDEECNFKRKFKGSLREPLVLVFNDLILWGIGNSLYGYGGDQLAKLLAVYFYGEYITRMATPELCERHKTMKSESVLSLGLMYTLNSALMDYSLEHTIGTPPYICLRTLRHFLLLLHINLASHMDLPLVKPQKEGIIVDPLVLYNHAKRFIVDVMFSGLMKRIPIDFKPPRGSKPFIPLSTFLKFLTKILDSDLEQIEISQPGFFKKNSKWLLPKMLHSTKNTVNDPVIKLFWPDIKEDISNIIEIVESAGKPVATLTTGPKPLASAVKYTLPTVLNYRFGLPIKLTEFLLSLSKKEDFWSFINAFKQWLGRNDISHKVILTEGSTNGFLHEPTKNDDPPSTTLPSKILSRPEELKTQRTPAVADARLLIPRKPPSTVSANSLFATKHRKTMFNVPLDIEEVTSLCKSLNS